MRAHHEDGQETSESVLPRIRRNTTLASVLALSASVLAVAYLDRAATSGAVLDWAICAAMTVIGLVHLAALVDGRTPLLTADEHEVRIRLGQEWLGLPWNAIEQVVVEHREGLSRDGRLVIAPRHLDAALEHLDRRSRRHARWHRRWYGAPLSVPLSLATRCVPGDLVEAMRVLSAGRTDVVRLRGRERARLDPVVSAGRAELGRLVNRLGAGGHDLDRGGGDPAAEESVLPATHLPGTASVPAPVPTSAPSPAPARAVPPVAPARAARAVHRVEIVREERPRIVNPLPEPERVEHVETSSAGAVVFDDFAPAAAPEPVIGPELRQARERAGLDVDQLSGRTMIRPHVLEAIEVDDFEPCGGDFYARGHLRTLARYLGLDVQGLLDRYDERYAHGPINARQVFEADLATGIGGGLRATSNGPRWSMLAAAVLVLLMAWGVARFFTDAPAEVTSPVPGIRDSAGLAANTKPITSELTRHQVLTISVRGATVRIVVRDRHQKVLWRGTLGPGGTHRVSGVAPFSVRTDHAAATRLRLAGKDLGPVGSGPAPGSRTIG